MKTTMFSVERREGRGIQQVVRTASVHPNATWWTCFTAMDGRNYEPQDFATLAEAEQAALAFVAASDGSPQ